MDVYAHQPMNGEPMKKLLAIALTSLALSAHAAESFKEPIDQLSQSQRTIRDKAASGDYQAMRNIAFSYASPRKGDAPSKVGACAWYLLIPAVHKKNFDVGDTGNIHLYCGRLSATEFDEAYAYAFRVLAK